ncbi:MAG: UDP-N-acetylmuramoyl-tripeptide--D-alanyl-D-alanine ligase [Robiginitomaculum sp.]|nr:MAG: UDP-N-acetylmuramoyl-tripeptide--D-alanyl-D-alanine ligase [Robiginitomaculum sp.]
MSALWTSGMAALATSGTCVGVWEINGISIDTRSLQPGDLFVPLKDIRDGHDFIPVAYEKGAGAVLSEYAIHDAPALIVKDTLGALCDLAVAARLRSQAKRIAVTGSVGKTSVKEMLAHVFRRCGLTHASQKSFNNHWGVPLTLATMPEETQFGVFEMGMNHKGELLDLTAIVRPNIAIITKVAPAHLAHFEDLSAIASAKAEILEGLSADGVAVLPRDSEFYTYFKKRAKKILSFGWHEDADARIVDIQHNARGSLSTLVVCGQKITLELPMVGEHWVENAACVLLSAKAAGIGVVKCANALKKMGAIKGRGEIHTLNVDGKSITLIDESYNANPESMGSAIAALGLFQGRTIAVLGDMLELGADEKKLHEDLYTDLQKADIHQVLCCGSRMKALDKKLSKTMAAGWFEGVETCLIELKKILRDQDTIMVKGSNASRMSVLVASLIAQEDKDK